MDQRTIRILVILAISGLNQTVQAATPQRSNNAEYFLRACRAMVTIADGGQVSNEALLPATYCTGYISGAMDFIALMPAVTGDAVTGDRPYVCLPQGGITNEQAARLFVKYLQENTVPLKESVRMTLFIAIVHAYPCK